MVTKTVTVARLLVTMAGIPYAYLYAAVLPAAVAGVGLHVIFFANTGYYHILHLSFSNIKGHSI